jgi:HD-like signal output (HDOD) protein
MSADPAIADPRMALVQTLADNLASGKIELPAFPDVVIRLRQLLENEDSTTAQIVQLLATEPVLAARLVQMANSTALRGVTSDLSDLNAVVNRLGREIVKSSAMAYAMKQMREAQKLEAAQPYLQSLWAESTNLAALCYVLASKLTKLSADQALLVGLLHGIGKLYILAQAEAQPSLFESQTTVDEVLESWHAAIGSAILEAWKFPEAVSGSVAQYQETAREHDGPTDLTDILIVAHLISRWIREEMDAELQLNEVPAAKHLAVTAVEIGEILSGAEEQIAALRAALGK